MKPNRSEIIIIRGLKYHVRHWGSSDAPLVILLHGWMDMSATFQFLVDACSKDWHFVAPDWRGFGKSASNHAPYWFPDYLADLDTLLDHYSPNKPVKLVGHSLGGNVACLYSGIRPQRISHLVTLEGFGMFPTSPADAPKQYRIWLDELKNPPRQTHYQTIQMMAERLKEANPRLDDDKAIFLAKHFSHSSQGGGYEWEADPWHRVINPILYRVEEAEAIWREVSAKVLWVAANNSFIMQRCRKNLSAYEARKSCFRDLTEFLVDDAGHNMHHDQPDKLATAVESFFKS